MKFEKFSRKELRWDFYPIFLKLMRQGLEIEAFLLIISTWNFAWFRYVARSFNLDRFIHTINCIKPEFKKFQKLDFRTIDFDRYEKEIKKIFKTLSNIKEIEKNWCFQINTLENPESFCNVG